MRVQAEQDARVQEARSLIERWASVQNAGDFDGYSALYAEAFRGIKRVGQRKSRYDRHRWLADRRRMFAKPMVVEARDLHVVAFGDRVSVTFVQSWTSARYSDVGTKSMVLAAGDNGLRITSEAMMDSDVVRSGKAQVDAEDFRFVIESQHLHMMIEITDEAGWLTEPPLMEAPRRHFAIARKRVRPDVIPERLASLRGRTVSLFGTEGRVCTATVGDFY